MSAEHAMLLTLKGAITELPADEQAKVQSTAEQIKAVIAENGDAGFIAMALVSAEMAVDA